MGRSDAAASQGLLIGTLQLARVTPHRAESDPILEAGGRAALRLRRATCLGLGATRWGFYPQPQIMLRQCCAAPFNRSKPGAMRCNGTQLELKRFRRLTHKCRNSLGLLRRVSVFES